MIKIIFPDGQIKEYSKGITPMDIALSISEGLARNVLAAKLNDQVVDSSTPILLDSNLQLLTWNDVEGKKTFWHSSAHLLAEAIEFLYPGTKFGIGPAIENGFYYDIDLGGQEFGQEQFKAIEDKMLELARLKLDYVRKEISKKDAVQYFTLKNDEYKLELLEGLSDGDITFYSQGNFTDLCKGPHIPSTSFIKAVKVLSVAGAYWR
jgi:threonyl-tRNA synthetase